MSITVQKRTKLISIPKAKSTEEVTWDFSVGDSNTMVTTYDTGITQDNNEVLLLRSVKYFYQRADSDRGSYNDNIILSTNESLDPNVTRSTDYSGLADETNIFFRNIVKVQDFSTASNAPADVMPMVFNAEADQLYGGRVIIDSTIAIGIARTMSAGDANTAITIQAVFT
jgi:hypothetical protein